MSIDQLEFEVFRLRRRTRTLTTSTAAAALLAVVSLLAPLLSGPGVVTAADLERAVAACNGAANAAQASAAKSSVYLRDARAVRDSTSAAARDTAAEPVPAALSELTFGDPDDGVTIDEDGITMRRGGRVVVHLSRPEGRITFFSGLVMDSPIPGMQTSSSSLDSSLLNISDYHHSIFLRADSQLAR